MKFFICLLVISTLIFLRIGINTVESEMDAETLIQLIDFYQTLIQDGEIKFLLYQKNPIHPDDIGKRQNTIISAWKEQMRDNVPRSQNPDALRRRLLNRIESEKKYGDFWDSNARFVFLESNLAFQVFRGKGKPGDPWSQYTYRLEKNHLFENYPSVEHIRFFGGRLQKYTISNPAKMLRIILPHQFNHDRIIGSSESLNPSIPFLVTLTSEVPPGFPLTKAGKNEVLLSKITTDEHTYLLTYRNPKNLEIKIYVRLKNGLPEIFKQEFYHKYKLPHTDPEKKSLIILKKYWDFEWVPELNITLPKVREEKRFRSDGFMHEHKIVTIKEMDFNIGFPADFFEWKASELSDDEGRWKNISGNVQKEEHQ